MSSKPGLNLLFSKCTQIIMDPICLSLFIDRMVCAGCNNFNIPFKKWYSTTYSNYLL